MTIRLARGYAPLPLPALEELAAGRRRCSRPAATEKNAIALWTGIQAVLSQHIGDLDQHETRTAFIDVAEDLSKLHGCEAAVLACDLHPDYFTTRWAMAEKKQVVQVQHHHAHAVACMVDNGLLDREVVALTWDGTGHGTDGVVWGGEVLRRIAASFSGWLRCCPFRFRVAQRPFTIRTGRPSACFMWFWARTPYCKTEGS